MKGVNCMKKAIKTLGIIALVAVIGFSFAACGGDDGDSTGNNNNNNNNNNGGNSNSGGGGGLNRV
jgi:hypothetical protein